MNNPWSKNGVALYPPKYPMVGQSRIFNALVNFRQQFSEKGDLSGFFVLVGDWGLGKTRIGYELIAESVGKIDEWLLDPSREYVTPNTNKRVLDPQFSDHILPLFIDYRSVTDGIGADIWAPKVACNALSLLWERPSSLRVSPDLLDDLAAALKAKNVNLSALKEAMLGVSDWKSKLEKAMAILNQHDIRYLWIIVDEVETPGDLKRNPDYIPGRDVEEEDLAMISQVIKEARYREDFPYVNFLLLCSLGMSDAIQIGPNRRRTDLTILEPNRIYDVKTFQKHLVQTDMEVNYPEGTLEGVFIATNRNFGWFNKVMSSIHAIWEDANLRGKPFEVAWKLINAYAMGAASNKDVFDLSILAAMSGFVPNSPESLLKDQLIFGQLPIPLDHQINSTNKQNLLQASIPGVGEAFAELKQIHIDSNTLAQELIKPEYGFKKSERPGDDYFNPYTEFSLSGVLSALRAFSIAVDVQDDFVIYVNIDQFAEQLTTLYPHERNQGGKSIEQAAEPLHKIFLRYVVKDKEYLGVSFKLLKKINVKMSVESRTISFFRDRAWDVSIENYVRENAGSAKSRMSLICKGMAKVIDDTAQKWLFDVLNDDCAFVSFESEFKNPHMPGLDVTLKGRVTIAYCGEPQKTAKELSDLLGRMSESAHPILVLFGPSGDIDGFQRSIERIPLLKKCVVLRKIISFEEEFLLRYSGKDGVFDPTQKPFSTNTLAIQGSLRQDLLSLFKTWKQEREQAGLILSPIWAKPTNIAKEDFYTGYRYLLVKNGTVDDLDPTTCQIANWKPLNLENFRNAAKKNVSPGTGSTAELLAILEDDEPYRPSIPNVLLQVLHELHSQASEDVLKKRFFFANREKEAAIPTTQILELLEAVGVVYRPAGINSAQYMAINKNQLENQRTIIKQWLQNQAPSLIRDIQDVFPERAKELEKADLSMAQTYLRQADEMAGQMQFSFIESSDPDSQGFIKLVQNLYQFEMLIQKICPLDPNEPFNLTSEQIKVKQDNYSNLSLWQKVQFLNWLRKQYIEKQNQILNTIEKQFVDMAKYQEIQGKPFPTVSITQVLRLIKNEVQSPIVGGTQTSMGWLPLQEFPLSISRYFLAGQFSEGWKRLTKLEEIASISEYSGVWQRFVRQAEAWKTIVNYYLQAKQAREQLEIFLNDAPDLIKNGQSDLINEFQTLDDLVSGGLENDIQQQIGSKPGLALLETLEEEVKAANKYQGLAGKMNERLKGLFQNLRSKIKAKRLEALNHVLCAAGKPEITAPQSAPTYQQTVDIYEGFNFNIEQQGKSLFEGQSKKTNWEMWVEIYQMFDSDKTKLKPEQEANINELVEMNLLVRSISLRR